MSKRRHRSRRETRRDVNAENRNNTTNNANNMNNRQGYNNGPFGINPNALLSSMFGNVDMNQINSLLQSMNTQGFDFNNLNLGNLQNIMGAMGNNLGQRPDEQHINNEKSNDNDYEEENNIDNSFNSVEKNDDNMQMLQAIRSIVGGERRVFIDKVIELYNNGKLE